jgi:hypothetical protein
MIEVYTFPIQRAVATCAIRGEAALMCVVLCVTGYASDWRALERLANMACFAGYGHMLAGEWKFGQAMIKLYILFPAGVAVTILASITQLALMNILRLVTADAGHLEF